MLTSPLRRRRRFVHPALCSVHGRRGLTLLEVVVAVALIVMLAGAMLTFFWRTVQVRDQTALESERAQIARQVLDRLAAELRACPGIEPQGLPAGPRLTGDRRSISFLTLRLPRREEYAFFDIFDQPPAEQPDLVQVRYQLWVDPTETTEDGEPIVGGIVRTETRLRPQRIIDEENPLEVRNDLWSPEIGYLEFRYFDGVEWDTKWPPQQGNTLPQAIRITVGFQTITRDELEDADLEAYPPDQFPYGDDQPHPDRYSVIVRLPAADRFLMSRIQRSMQQMMSQAMGNGPNQPAP